MKDKKEEPRRIYVQGSVEKRSARLTESDKSVSIDKTDTPNQPKEIKNE
ncbi:hypothetical protein HPL003_17640 [Paenibacillus terrae HPL-003]|uniref:Uncharacterized protein n=1 Tax=Paenibacillus terrae (strain HPL-003) TaxID=985665 RepID=G7W0U5_PAETH|nr:hypothetical protein [Paenibacillus terrae]AET60272.1 hypothetical protein HPL003_17640 [Paenibacillus terrae HPL-003]